MWAGGSALTCGVLAVTDRARVRRLGLGHRGRASVCAHVPDLASSTSTQTLRLPGHHLLSKRDYVPRVASLSFLCTELRIH